MEAAGPVPRGKRAAVHVDGYAWVKYGEKLLTPSRITREYYKCKNWRSPSTGGGTGCKARKVIDQEREDNGETTDESAVLPKEEQCNGTSIAHHKEAQGTKKRPRAVFPKHLPSESLEFCQHNHEPPASPGPGPTTADPWLFRVPGQPPSSADATSNALLFQETAAFNVAAFQFQGCVGSPETQSTDENVQGSQGSWKRPRVTVNQPEGQPLGDLGGVLSLLKASSEMLQGSKALAPSISTSPLQHHRHRSSSRAQRPCSLSQLLFGNDCSSQGNGHESPPKSMECEGHDRPMAPLALCGTHQSLSGAPLSGPHSGPMQHLTRSGTWSAVQAQPMRQWCAPVHPGTQQLRRPTLAQQHRAALAAAGLGVAGPGMGPRGSDCLGPGSQDPTAPTTPAARRDGAPFIDAQDRGPVPGPAMALSDMSTADLLGMLLGQKHHGRGPEDLVPSQSGRGSGRGSGSGELRTRGTVLGRGHTVPRVLETSPRGTCPGGSVPQQEMDRMVWPNATITSSTSTLSTAPTSTESALASCSSDVKQQIVLHNAASEQGNLHHSRPAAPVPGDLWPGLARTVSALGSACVTHTKPLTPVQPRPNPPWQAALQAPSVAVAEQHIAHAMCCSGGNPAQVPPGSGASRCLLATGGRLSPRQGPASVAPASAPTPRSCDSRMTVQSQHCDSCMEVQAQHCDGKKEHHLQKDGLNSTLYNTSSDADDAQLLAAAIKILEDELVQELGKIIAPQDRQGGCVTQHEHEIFDSAIFLQ